jgi:hypothetical protein
MNNFPSKPNAAYNVMNIVMGLLLTAAVIFTVAFMIFS